MIPVNDVNSVCRVCFVGADSPYKCEKIVNVKRNLVKPSKEDTRGKHSSLLRSEVRPSTELSHNMRYKCKRDIDRITKNLEELQQFRELYAESSTEADITPSSKEAVPCFANCCGWKR